MDPNVFNDANFSDKIQFDITDMNHDIQSMDNRDHNDTNGINLHNYHFN